MVNERHSFRGYTDSFLYWDVSDYHWRLESTTNSSVFAITEGFEYPFGTQEWEIHGDTCYGDKEERHMQLNINACREKEFNCHDGYCIDVNERCDGKVDCPDKSGN